MKISFIIPAYNEEYLIGNCLSSVKREADAHPEVDVEIIVANNGSRDRTKEIASSYPDVIVVDEPHKGIVWARQAGFKASTGELLANIDADTSLPEGWLETVLEEFARLPDMVALTGPHVYLDGSFYVRAMTRIWYMVGYALDQLGGILTGKRSMFQGGNFVLRRSALEKLGGYDTSINFYGEDVDTGRRLRDIGDVNWTFRLPIHASARRINKNGLLKTGFLYGISYIWISAFGKPFTQNYDDIRVKTQNTKVMRFFDRKNTFAHEAREK